MSESKSEWTSTERDRRNQHRVVTWSLAWVLAFLAADYAIELEWIDSEALAVAATAVVSIIGLGWLLAFRRFIRDADELMRKIQLDALALAVGVGVVVSFSYSLIANAGIVTEADVLSVVLIMILTYVVSVVTGQRKYR